MQTADECVLPGGTAFISDCGMTGPLDTVIGVKTDIILDRFLTVLPQKFQVPKTGRAILSAVLIRTVPDGPQAEAIQRLSILSGSPDEGE